MDTWSHYYVYTQYTQLHNLMIFNESRSSSKRLWERLKVIGYRSVHLNTLHQFKAKDYGND